MDNDTHAIDVLNELVPKAHYESRGRSITGTEYRNAWNSPIPALSRAWILTEVTRPEGFNRLVDILRSMLEPFMTTRDEKEFVRTNIGLIAAGGGAPTELDRFASDVLTSAVLIGPYRTVALVRAWAEGESVRYTRFTVLSGFRIENDQQQFLVDEGLRIQSLPRNQNELLALGAPEMWVGSPLSMVPPLGGPKLYGSPAMVVEMEHGPVFVADDQQWPESRPVAAGPFGFNDPSLNGLSLACGSAVSPSCAWSRIPVEVQSFVPWARSTPNHVVLYGEGLRRSSQVPILTNETLTQAIHLAAKMVEHGLGNKALTALARWTKSMHGHISDQFIDLRIALEALYAPDGGGGEISYRLQTRCARHMAQSFNDRQTVARDVKGFYSTASRFAHGDLVAPSDRPSDPKHQQQLERARSICRDALIKIIDENKGSDVNVAQLTLA